MASLPVESTERPAFLRVSSGKKNPDVDCGETKQTVLPLKSATLVIDEFAGTMASE